MTLFRELSLVAELTTVAHKKNTVSGISSFSVRTVGFSALAHIILVVFHCSILWR